MAEVVTPRRVGHFYFKNNNASRVFPTVCQPGSEVLWDSKKKSWDWGFNQGEGRYVDLISDAKMAEGEVVTAGVNVWLGRDTQNSEQWTVGGTDVACFTCDGLGADVPMLNFTNIQPSNSPP